MNIIDHRRTWLIAAGVEVLLGITFLLVFGLKLGIDFTGGSLIELEFQNRPSIETIKKDIADKGLAVVSVQSVGDRGVLLRAKDLSSAEHQQWTDTFREIFQNVEEKRFETIGPTIGKELKEKSLYAILLVLAGIIGYITYAFRKISGAIQSWKFGVCALAALFHDVLLVVAVFGVLGKFLNVEVDTLFLTALLTVLGYSVNDTIVIFDRIRENLARHPEIEVKTNINNSLNQTMVRSLNTTITTLLALLAVFFFGGTSIRYFILALIIGIATGAYSSIFIASPLLAEWYEWSHRKK